MLARARGPGNASTLREMARAEDTLYGALAEPVSTDWGVGQTHVTAAKETIDWDEEEAHATLLLVDQ